MRLGFVGTPEVTSSIVTGLRSSGGTGHSVCLSPRNPVIARDLATRFGGVSIASSNQEVLDLCDTVVIAVRPAAAREILSALRFRTDHHIVSAQS
jgi:pyrroline-5-carboxylate reductase